MKPEASTSESAPAPLRRWLWATYVAGSAGLCVELLLMEHVEGVWQQLPLWLLAASLATLSLLPLRWPAVVHGFRVLMVAVAACGLLGVYLHFEGKAEFKRELDPALSGWPLLWECLYGHSLPPVLAPGMLVMLGMLGLACVYRHPILLARITSIPTQQT